MVEGMPSSFNVYRMHLPTRKENVCILRDARHFAQSETMYKSLVHQATAESHVSVLLL